MSKKTRLIVVGVLVGLVAIVLAQVLGSLVTADRGKLKTFTSQVGRFMVQMPPAVQREHETIDTRLGVLESTRFGSRSKFAQFLVIYYDYPDEYMANTDAAAILKGAAEVIVTDGFTGNIVLKTVEGVSDNWLSSLNQTGQIFAKAYRLPLRILHRDIGMDSWTQRLDYRAYGGACLLGVNGNVIIAHGRSQSTAIKNAIGLAKQTVERGICQRIRGENYEPVSPQG